MTTVYNDYYKAIEDGSGQIDDVHFGAKLVGSGYFPDPSDKPEDVTDVILDAPTALVGEVMTQKGMSEIVEILLKRLRAYANQTPMMGVEPLVLDERIKTALDTLDHMALKEAGGKYLVVYSTILPILCFTEEV